MEIHDPTPGLYDAILSRSLHFSTPVIPGITDPIIIAYQTDIESLESQQHYFDALRTVFESTVIWSPLSLRKGVGCLEFIV